MIRPVTDAEAAKALHLLAADLAEPSVDELAVHGAAFLGKRCGEDLHRAALERAIELLGDVPRCRGDLIGILWLEAMRTAERSRDNCAEIAELFLQLPPGATRGAANEEVVVYAGLAAQVNFAQRSAFESSVIAHGGAIGRSDWLRDRVADLWKVEPGNFAAIAAHLTQK